MNLLEDGAVVRAGRRDWCKAPEERDGALKQTRKLFLRDQGLEPVVEADGRQNKHIAELPANC